MLAGRSALIRSYIEGKYFSTPQSFLKDQADRVAADVALKLIKGEMNPEDLLTIMDGQANFAGALAVNVMDSVLKGEMDFEAL